MSFDPSSSEGGKLDDLEAEPVRDMPDADIEAQIETLKQLKNKDKNFTPLMAKKLKRLKRVQSSRLFRAKEKQSKLQIKTKAGKLSFQKT